MSGTSVCPDRDDVFKSGVCLTISHKKRTLGHICVDLVRRTGLKKEETATTSDRHLFLLNLKGVAEDGQYFADKKPIAFIRRKPGSVLFVPAGVSLSGWETGEQSAAYVAISVDPTLTAKLMDNKECSIRPLPPSLGLDDPILTHAAWRIAEEMSDKTALTDLLIESYARTMLVQIFRRGRQAVFQKTMGGISPSALNRVMEKINSDPSAELTLSELAEIAGLSIPHFCRAFKQSVGRPPHAFVVQRRIEMAKSYLQFSGMSITEIAYLCGFSNSSHFSNSFSREVGVTPQSFRGK